MIKPGSIRLRLTLWNMAVLGLILAVFAVAVHFSVKTVLMTSVDRDLMHEVDAVSTHLAFANIAVFNRVTVGGHGPDIPFPGFHSKGTTVLQMTKSEIIPKNGNMLSLPIKLNPLSSDREKAMVFRVVGPDGNPFSSPPKNLKLLGVNLDNLSEHPSQPSLIFSGLPPKSDGFSTISAQGRQWRVYSKPWHMEGSVVGKMQVAYPTDELRNLLHGLDLTLFGLIPLTLLGMGMGGIFLTSRALRPVRRIAEAAAEVEATDLSKRLPVTGKDEFSELAGTFNGMFGRLEVAFTRQEALLEQQRRLTADASHELRTPLTTIKANADWALRKERTAAEYTEALTATTLAADRMNRIVEDLLCLARSDNGQLEIKISPVPVSKIVQDVIEECQSQSLHSQTAQACIRVSEIPGDLLVFGDAHYLSRLLHNLVDNAQRHTPPEGEITISAEGIGEKVRLTVRDTGEGIPPEHLPHICERFYRVDDSRTRSKGGTGLGLAICQSIVQAHQGTMEIESEVGRGTIVTITLPRTQ